MCDADRAGEEQGERYCEEARSTVCVDEVCDLLTVFRFAIIVIRRSCLTFDMVTDVGGEYR